jgi:hypothetical protein
MSSAVAAARTGAMEPNVVEDPLVLRQRLSFSRSVDPDGGEVLHVETWVQPGGFVSPHIHPAMEERFEVLAGNPSFLAGRKGMRHAYRNETDEPVHMVCHARPPSTLQEFLETAVALGSSGKLTRRGLPKSVGALLKAAAMAERHREMAVLLFPPMPPPFVQRLLFPLLARLAERRA